GGARDDNVRNPLLGGGAKRHESTQNVVDQHLAVMGPAESDAGCFGREIDEEITVAQDSVARLPIAQIALDELKPVCLKCRDVRGPAVFEVVDDGDAGAAGDEDRHEVRTEKPASAANDNT